MAQAPPPSPSGPGTGGAPQPSNSRWSHPLLIAVAGPLVGGIFAVVAVYVGQSKGTFPIPSGPSPRAEATATAPSATTTPPPETNESNNRPQVSDSSAPGTPPLEPGEIRYELAFGDDTNVDLDTGLANRTGGPEYEVHLDFGRLFTGESHGLWETATVVYIEDSQVSFDGCARGTLIQGEVAHLNEVEQNQTICVSTNRGAWAAMKIRNVEPSSSGLGAGDIEFDVRLFRPGG